jgi:hypothetical protein
MMMFPTRRLFLIVMSVGVCLSSTGCFSCTETVQQPPPTVTVQPGPTVVVPPAGAPTP